MMPFPTVFATAFVTNAPARFAIECARVIEVEAELLGADLRTLLAGPFSEHVFQGAVQQVSGGVMAAGAVAADRIDVGVGQLALHLVFEIDQRLLLQQLGEALEGQVVNGDDPPPGHRAARPPPRRRPQCRDRQP